MPAPWVPPLTPPVVLSASKRLSICSRLRVLLPRISMLPAKLAAGGGLRRMDSRSPKRKSALNTTVPPRVFFGSSETVKLLPMV